MKPTTKPKVKAKKQRYVSDETFGKIVQSIAEMVAYERGEQPHLRVTRVAVPPKSPIKMSKHRIVGIRKRLHCSRLNFARILNVSPRTLEAWEQGVREPSDAALKLLSIADKHPEVLLDV
jgi:putative transcriptional regulator